MTNNGCSLCGTQAQRIKEVVEPIYFHCPNCDLIFMDNNFIIDSTEEKTRYSLHRNSPDNTGYVNMFERFIDVGVKPFCAGLKNGLDFGCGPGPVLSQLITKLGINMDIYDPYFYNNPEIKEKKYDLITSTEVFEHLKNPRSEIGFLKEILNPGGLLAIMTLFHDQCNFKTWWYRRDSTHICFYSTKTCHWIADHFDFKIRYINSKNTCVWQKN